MDKYYYNKYSLKDVWRRESTPFSQQTIGNLTWSGYTDYRIKSSDGTFEVSRDYVTINREISSSHPGLHNTLENNTVLQTVTLSSNVMIERRYHAISTKEKNLYIETITAEDGTYPDAGISGNYYYIKKGLVFPSMKIRVDGTLKTSVDGWVKVNGTLKHIDSMLTKVDGVLKKI